MTMQAKLRAGNPIMRPYTPNSAVSAGDVVVQGDAPTIAHLDIAASTLGDVAIFGGIYDAIADGAIGVFKRVYWDDSANKVTLTASGNKPLGLSLTATSTDGDAIQIFHCPGDVGAIAGTVAALTDSSGGAAADGTIGVVTLPTLAGWNGSTDPSAAEATQIIVAVTACRDGIKELATKVNAILTSLKAAGLMA